MIFVFQMLLNLLTIPNLIKGPIFATFTIFLFYPFVLFTLRNNTTEINSNRKETFSFVYFTAPLFGKRSTKQTFREFSTQYTDSRLVAPPPARCWLRPHSFVFIPFQLVLQQEAESQFSGGCKQGAKYAFH